MEPPPGPVSRREQEFSFSPVAITLDVVNNQTKAALLSSIEQQGWNLTRHGWWLLLQRCSALQWKDWASGRVRRTHCLRQRKAKAASATCSCCLPLASPLLCFQAQTQAACLCASPVYSKGLHWMDAQQELSQCKVQSTTSFWSSMGLPGCTTSPKAHLTSIQK